MPANLPPQYYEVERQFRSAKTDRERLSLLQKMLRMMPKHKGTDKLQADVKKRISRFKQAIKKGKKSGKSSFTYHVPREGEAQIYLAGAPNTGKSNLVTALTRAQPQVADYPFSTRVPLPGMMIFENIQFQLVDMPPVSSDYMERWVPAIMRNGDACFLVFDLSSENALGQIDSVLEELKRHHLYLSNEPSSEKDPVGMMRVRTLLVGTHSDAGESGANSEKVRELYEDHYPLIPFSAATGEGAGELAKQLYDLLGFIRVYSRTRWREPNLSQPVVLDKDSTVEDFARVIHKELAVNMKYARIWGEGRIDGQQVQKDFHLIEGDVIEISLK